MPVDDMLGAIKEYGGMFGKGILIKMAPRVAKGVLVSILVERKVDVKKATEWVQNDICLWDTLEEDEKDMLGKLKGNIGELDWLTATWIIDAIKRELPAVASLFLGWKKASNWLERQARIIREKVTDLTN